MISHISLSDHCNSVPSSPIVMIHSEPFLNILVARSCPNSIRSILLKSQILLKTRFSTCFEHVTDKSETKKRHGHVEIDLAGLRRARDIFVESRF